MFSACISVGGPAQKRLVSMREVTFRKICILHEERLIVISICWSSLTNDLDCLFNENLHLNHECQFENSSWLHWTVWLNFLLTKAWFILARWAERQLGASIICRSEASTLLPLCNLYFLNAEWQTTQILMLKILQCLFFYRVWCWLFLIRNNLCLKVENQV